MNQATEGAQKALEQMGFLVVSWPLDSAIPEVYEGSMYFGSGFLEGWVDGPFRVIGRATHDDYRRQSAILGIPPDKIETAIALSVDRVMLKMAAE